MLMTDLEECGCLFALVAMRERERGGAVSAQYVYVGESQLSIALPLFSTFHRTNLEAFSPTGWMQDELTIPWMDKIQYLQ